MTSKPVDDNDLCPTRLIRDSASTEDAFRHRNVAEAIAQMIATEPGGCAVALTGSWGSGKSSVVRLLYEKLTLEQPNIKVFIFDAWSHQGDPLRRTFLETMIDWAKTDKLLADPSTAWDKVKAQLSARIEKSTVKTKPKFEPWGIAAAIAVLVTPAALQLYQKIHFEWHPLDDALALLISLTPALIALAAYLIWLMDRQKTFPTFFVSDVIKESESETSKSPDPTSVEFEDYYKKLMGEILEASKRKALLVIDNLDRVSPDDAKSIWATLRIFFDPAIQSSTNWSNRVWVLVPFDPDGVTRLWNGEKKTDGPLNGRGETPQEAGEHFLEKTFVATFQVPPVITSNWESFMLKQLEFAFPTHKTEEFAAIFRLFDSILLREAKSPTPRNIKLFINNLGALHRQWQDSIPLAEQALFLLLSSTHRKNFQETIRNLGSNPIIPVTLISLLTPNWQKNIAALYFNVDPSIAFQELLSPRIKTALAEGDQKAMIEIQSHPAFRHELERVLEKSYGVANKITPQVLALNAHAISGLGEQGDGLFDPLLRATHSVTAWPQLENPVIEGILALVEATPESHSTTHFATSLANSLTFDAGATDGPNVKKWLNAVEIILPKLATRDTAGLTKVFTVPGTPEQFLTVLEEGRKRPKCKGILKFFRPRAGLDQIQEVLGQQVTSGSWSQIGADNFYALLAIDGRWNLDQFVRALDQRLTQILQTNGNQPSDLPWIVQTLFEISNKSVAAKNTLTNAANSEAILGAYFWLSQSQTDAAALCAIVTLFSKINLDRQDNAGYQGTSPNHRIQQGRRNLRSFTQNPDSNVALLTAISKKCLAWFPYESWRMVTDQIPTRKTVVFKMIEGAAREPGAPKIPTRELTENLDFWQELLGEKALRLEISNRATQKDLVDTLKSRPFELSEAWLHLLVAQKNRDEEYRKTVSSALRARTRDEWFGAMKAESPLIEIVLALSDAKLGLAQPFLDALNSHVDWRLSQPTAGRLSPDWHKLVEQLPPTSRDAFQQTLWNSFWQGKGNISGLLPYYGELLAKSVLDHKPEEASSRLEQIINNKFPAEVDWLAKTLAKWKPSTQSAQGIRKNLLERAREGSKAEDDEKKRISLDELCKTLGKD